MGVLLQQLTVLRAQLAMRHDLGVLQQMVARHTLQSQLCHHPQAAQPNPSHVEQVRVFLLHSQHHMGQPVSNLVGLSRERCEHAASIDCTVHNSSCCSSRWQICIMSALLHSQAALPHPGQMSVQTDQQVWILVSAAHTRQHAAAVAAAALPSEPAGSAAHSTGIV